jgi:hypothetical protein
MPQSHALEREFLEGFLEQSKVCQGALVTRPQQDPPDFVIKSGSFSAAVELTCVFVDSDRKSYSEAKKGSSDQSWVRREIQILLTKRGVQPMYVMVGFAHDRVRTDRRALAIGITDLIVRHNPPGTNQVDVDWHAAANAGEFGKSWPEDLDHISMLRPAICVQMNVDGASAGWEREECETLLQLTLEGKAVDLHRYSVRCDQNWLLMVAEGDDASSFIDPSEESRRAVYTSRFDRAFFYRHAFSMWFELTLSKPSGCLLLPH